MEHNSTEWHHLFCLPAFEIELKPAEKGSLKAPPPEATDCRERHKKNTSHGGLISSQARVRARTGLYCCAHRLIYVRALAVSWFVVCCVSLQVSEVEMRGMLALETELSVEEILVYRDVAR